MADCEICHISARTREFMTSGAMHRGVQFCWEGQLCDKCLEKVMNFELDIVAYPPLGRAYVNPVYELWRRGASDEQIRDFIRGELTRPPKENPC